MKKKIEPYSFFSSLIPINNTPNGSVERQLITLDSPKSPIAEAYRSLRTTLLYSNTKKSEIKSLIVSSAGPGDGKRRNNHGRKLSNNSSQYGKKLS